VCLFGWLGTKERRLIANLALAVGAQMVSVQCDGLL